MVISCIFTYPCLSFSELFSGRSRHAQFPENLSEGIYVLRILETEVVVKLLCIWILWIDQQSGYWQAHFMASLNLCLHQFLGNASATEFG